MKKVKLNLTVEVAETVAPEKVAEIVQSLISCGLADAASTLEDREGNIEDARLADSMLIFPPTVAEQLRVLVVVAGGIADHVADDGVDVEIFDRDNYKDDPKGIVRPPKRFADLAAPLNVPVAED